MGYGPSRGGNGMSKGLEVGMYKMCYREGRVRLEQSFYNNKCTLSTMC